MPRKAGSEMETPATNNHEQSSYEQDVLRVLQSKDETKAFYNKLARVYDLLAEHSEQPMREIGLQMLAAQPGQTVLEIGFGTGHCLVELAKAVGSDGRVLGIDIAEKMIAETQRLLAQEALADRVHLVCGDAEHLPYAEGSIDAIFMSFTLELFDTPAIPRVLAECRRVLRPGGRLANVSISKEGKPGIVLRAFEWTHRHFPNLMDCRPIYVARALEAAGFEVRQVRHEHMWIPVEIVLGVKSNRHSA